VLQNILGHVSILTTVKYTHLTSVSQRDTHSQINQLMGSFEFFWGKIK